MKNKPCIDTNDLPEFIGQIIDIFEDFLDEKGVILENEERDCDPDLDPEFAANIYGSDYDQLQDEIRRTLEHWNICKKE